MSRSATERPKILRLWRIRCLPFLSAVTLAFFCEGCAYRLYAPLPPSTERLRVVANNPEHYRLHIQERAIPEDKSERTPHTRVFHETDYAIPSNGLVTITIPAYRPDCGVYLFNWVKVGGGGDSTLKLWELTVLSEMRPVRVLSLNQVRDLPSDTAGYRLISVSQ